MHMMYMMHMMHPMGTHIPATPSKSGTSFQRMPVPRAAPLRRLRRSAAAPCVRRAGGRATEEGRWTWRLWARGARRQAGGCGGKMVATAPGMATRRTGMRVLSEDHRGHRMPRIMRMHLRAALDDKGRRCRCSTVDSRPSTAPAPRRGRSRRRRCRQHSPTRRRRHCTSRRTSDLRGRLSPSPGAQNRAWSLPGIAPFRNRASTRRTALTGWPGRRASTSRGSTRRTPTAKYTL